MLGISGCFPYKYTLRPAVSGQVIRADTGAPIEGALVVDRLAEALKTRSTADGSFLLPPHKEWGIWFILPQEPMFVNRIGVSADGFLSKELAVRPFGPTALLSGPVRLDPVPK